MGLNLNQQNFGIRGARPISVAQLTGRQYDHGTMLVQCANAVWNRLLALQHTEMQAYLARLYRYGTTAIFAANGKTFEGTIVGVADDGMLQLKMPDGRSQQFAFKEIEYIFENL